jgi:AbrB family looped-hinge helix DNA binding protein
MDETNFAQSCYPKENGKPNSIIRRIDDIGRIPIPKEIRRQLRIREGDKLEITTENDRIVLKKI